MLEKTEEVGVSMSLFLFVVTVASSPLGSGSIEKESGAYLLELFMLFMSLILNGAIECIVTCVFVFAFAFV